MSNIVKTNQNKTVFNCDPDDFETYQRKARVICQASMFTGSGLLANGTPEEKFANALIIMDVSASMNVSPLIVNQEMYSIHGKPSFSSKFMIACFPLQKDFHSLRYESHGKPSDENFGVRAYATEVATGDKVYGPWVTIKMAKAEGWYGKKGSKWQSIPELMARYRAAAFFIRTYCPSVSMGFLTQEEVEDTNSTMQDVTPQSDTPAAAPAMQKKSIVIEDDYVPDLPDAKPIASPKEEPATVVDVTPAAEVIVETVAEVIPNEGGATEVHIDMVDGMNNALASSPDNKADDNDELF